MPTTKGFTGQYSDASTGLDYYGARYYDPTLGQFTSADTVGGLNRYGYVAGNPETATDPTGHRIWTGGFDSSVGNLCPPPPKLSGVSELATAAGVLKAARELQLKLSVTQKRLAVWEARVAYQDIKDAYRLAHGAGSIPHSVRRPGAKSVSDSNDDLNSKLEETEGDVYALNHGVGTALIGVGAGMDGALAGHQQWIEDDGKYGFVQHVLRAGVADIAHSLFSTAVAATGAAIGGFFGLVVGAAVGGIIGGVAGLIAGSTVAPGLGTVGGAMAGIDVGVETGGDIGLVGGG